MQAKTQDKVIKFAALFLTGAAVLLLITLRIYRQYQEKHQQYYTIGVLYNSVNLSPEDLEVIKFMIDKRVSSINEQGGFAGRNLKVKYLDDKGSRETVYKVVKESINDESLVAYMGCWSSSRVQAVAELVGKAGVPFIGGYSVTGITNKYPNMFSYEISIGHVAFVLHKLLNRRAKKVTLIANSEDLYSVALLDDLKKKKDTEADYKLIEDVWYPDKHKFTKAELKQIAYSVKATGTDFLILSTNPHHTNQIVRALSENKVQIPVFTAFTDIPEIDPEIPGYNKMELFDISVFGIPSALNLRQQRYQAQNNMDLELDKKSAFRLGLGGLHADAIGMLKEAAEMEPEPKSSIRESIIHGMQRYINGYRVYQGWFSDWYFTEDRALVSEALLGWKPPGSENLLLAPFQYLRGDSAMQEAQVMFTNIDMEELGQVNDEDGTFDARFFLNLSSNRKITISHIEFPNAVRNDNNHLPILSIKLLRADSTAGKVGMYNYLYRISGKFYFEPDLREYPFDEQQFPISIQTNSTFKPFLMQPAGSQNRDTIFNSEGWIYRSNFVGFDHELIGSYNKFIKAKRHIPYYKFNFTYVLKRAKVDFFLKTLTPLLAILIITYFSVYIPIRQFEALSAIQVTALLSSIALYFSAYKSQGQFATTSDKIFIFTYIMVTTLIGASIFQYWLYSKRTGKRQLAIIVSVYERILFPIIVIGYTFFFIV
ncbi:ABC transporter substrate-binding protein [Adhaeribacter terreus]|uniref:ABC transporter substrate-binding protein n=1 Tax=Adhaeribacter terreus TaxID=529703 RepID=UPI003A8D8274